SARLPNVALLKIKLKEGTDTASLFGSHDAHLKMIEEALGIRVSARGEEVLLNGPAAAVRNGERLLDGLTNLMSEGVTLRRDDVEYAIRNLQGGQDPSYMKESLRDGIELGSGKRVIVPKTPMQRRYIEAISKHDLILGLEHSWTCNTSWAITTASAQSPR